MTIFDEGIDCYGVGQRLWLCAVWDVGCSVNQGKNKRGGFLPGRSRKVESYCNLHLVMQIADGVEWPCFLGAEVRVDEKQIREDRNGRRSGID